LESQPAHHDFHLCPRAGGPDTRFRRGQADGWLHHGDEPAARRRRFKLELQFGGSAHADHSIVAKKPHVYLKNIGSRHLVLADFNNDGIFDFAADYGFHEIKTFLGNGDGTFTPGSIATYNYFSAAAISSGDFNNDGNEDLVFGARPNGPPTYLQLNLGGQCKFMAGTRFGHFKVTLSESPWATQQRRNLDIVSVTALTLFLFFWSRQRKLSSPGEL
jgi:hypothetical protein